MVMIHRQTFRDISFFDAFVKRIFDIIFSLLGLLMTGWLIVLAFVVATLETRSFGLFKQKRIGRNARLFTVYKIKTMKRVAGNKSTITAKNDSRITSSGAFFRSTKIDELPQLWNVLRGDMSFVGPRPDMPGYADMLQGDDRILLTVRPGITGPASIKYKNEEEILAICDDPKKYNDEVIWPDKVRVNKEYIKNYSFWKDIEYIWKTIID